MLPRKLPRTVPVMGRENRQSKNRQTPKQFGQGTAIAGEGS